MSNKTKERKLKPVVNKEESEALLQRFIDKYGVKNVENVWGILERQEGFVRAMDTEVGQQMMKDLIELASKAKNAYEGRLMNSQSTDKMDMSTVKALIQYHTYMHVIKIFKERVNTYYKLSDV